MTDRFKDLGLTYINLEEVLYKSALVYVVRKVLDTITE